MSGSSSCAGEVLFGSPFTSASAQVPEGITLPFSLQMPAGDYRLEFELVEQASGVVAAGGSTLFSSAL